MKRITIILSLFLTLGLTSNTAFANDTEGVSFGVMAVLPENQANEQATYFDIEMTPGQKQELEVIITNDGDEPIQVAVSNNDAATNINGVITYDGSQKNYRSGMKNPLSEISEFSEEIVTVPANDQVSIYITVEAPKKSFDGQILGGLHFLLLNDEDENAEGVTIQNQYAYVIGLNITEKDNDTEIVPELVLLGVQTDEINHRPGLQTTFENPTPSIISGLNFEGRIFLVDSDEEVYSRTVEHFSVAPNNRFNFPITFDQGKLEPGNYVYTAKAYTDDYEWEFEEPFTVEEENN